MQRNLHLSSGCLQPSWLDQKHLTAKNWKHIIIFQTSFVTPTLHRSLIALQYYLHYWCIAAKDFETFHLVLYGAPCNNVVPQTGCLCMASDTASTRCPLLCTRTCLPAVRNASILCLAYICLPSVVSVLTLLTRRFDANSRVLLLSNLHPTIGSEPCCQPSNEVLYLFRARCYRIDEACMSLVNDPASTSKDRYSRSVLSSMSWQTWS